jgi:hypothetical protein
VVYVETNRRDIEGEEDRWVTWPNECGVVLQSGG